MCKQRVTGFTLIEILVVLFVVAILVTITLPVFMNMRRSGRFNTCVQNMKEIGTALALYHGDYGRYPAPPGQDYLRFKDWRALPYSIARTWEVNPSSVNAVQATGLIDEPYKPVVGMSVVLRPAARWTITSKPTTLSLVLNSVANLKGVSDLTPGHAKYVSAVKLTDPDAGSTEQWAIDHITGNEIFLKADASHAALVNAYAHGGTAEAVIPGERRTISGINMGTGVITFGTNLNYDYSNGGTLEMEPIRVLGQGALPPDQLRLQRTAGLVGQMRVTIKDRRGIVIAEPMITDITGDIVTFNCNLLDLHLFSGGETVEWTIDNFGLATLYEQYLSDQHSYLRSYQRFHCPTDTSTEKVDRGRVLNELVAGAPSVQAYHTFDPLFGGYNSYDVTYNYDQFAREIATFDTEMNYGGSKTNAVRQLRNPNPPADTVVCWCGSHNNGGEMPNGRVPDAIMGEVEQQQADRMNLVLWLDGSVAPVRPYLARDNQGHGYWVPTCLVTRGEAKK